MALAEDLGLTAVTLGVPDVHSPFSSVSVDDGAGIRQTVDHLAHLGHRDIAHVAGPDAMLHAGRRTHAFADAAAGRGIRSRIVPTDFSAAEGAAATRALLDALAGMPPVHLDLAEPTLVIRESTGPAPRTSRDVRAARHPDRPDKEQS